MQFSLKTAFTVLTLAAVWCGWISFFLWLNQITDHPTKTFGQYATIIVGSTFEVFSSYWLIFCLTEWAKQAWRRLRSKPWN